MANQYNICDGSHQEKQYKRERIENRLLVLLSVFVTAIGIILAKLG